MGGGREAGHIQAGLGDDGAGQVLADAGDLRQLGHGGQYRGIRPGARDKAYLSADQPASMRNACY